MCTMQAINQEQRNVLLMLYETIKAILLYPYYGKNKFTGKDNVQTERVKEEEVGQQQDGCIQSDKS